jgi:EAL domain-containing protein (putative c-di-GMP-specific phosphodiesterase class I)/GGDEF domain-containing protein
MARRNPTRRQPKGIAAILRFQFMELIRSAPPVDRASLARAGETFRHGLQLYDHVDFLAQTLADCAARAVAAGEAAILIVRDRNRQLLGERLAGAVIEGDGVRASGQIEIVSAEEILTAVMAEGWPDPEAFNRKVGGLIRAASAKWPGVQIAGELVAVLWDAGHPAMALRLEQLQEELAETERFSLLCLYPLSSFQSAGQALGFGGVCDSHTFVLPTESYLKLDREEDRLRAVARLQQAALPQAAGPESLGAGGETEQLTSLLKEAGQAREGSGPMSLVMIALDNGSGSAQEAGQRLQAAFGGAGKRVIQTGSDEFALIAADLPDFASAHGVVQQLRQTLDQPQAGAGAVRISASIGIEIAPSGTDPLTVRRNAELALRHARQKGRGQTEFYSARLGKSARVHQHLESRLKEAIERNEFQIFFQPEISLKTLRPSRFEALLRWFPSPDCSVPPSTFIPLAEESGLIPEIGEWVLRESCLRAAEWQRSPLAGVGVAVNVSALQFRAPGFIVLVEDILRETGLRPGLLELELTESVLIRDFDQSNNTLKALKQLGVTIAIDDFGTGYSSLGYLQKLSVDALKIDRCFVSGLEDFQARAPVLRGVVGIARELGIRIIAEGIETPEQYHAVARLGCDEVQGFLTGRPAACAREWRPDPGEERAA